MKKWYNKYKKSDKQGNLNCPNCDYHFEERLLYIIEPNTCPNCSTSIGFLDISPYHPIIYTIDLQNCPILIKSIFDKLSEMNAKDGYNQLKELFFMITSDPE